MADERRDELDRMLDSALASYSAEEPRPGLEARALARVRAEGRRRRFAWAPWAVVTAAAACLCIWAALPGSKPVEPPRPLVSQAPSAAIVVTQAPAPVERAHPRRRPALPKREQFPTPTPLTEEERILAGLAARSPEKAVELMMSRNSDPIQIEEIHIEPLSNGE